MMLEHLFEETNIEIVRGNFQDVYPGIVIELNGPYRHTDPSIWSFKDEEEAKHVLSYLTSTIKYRKALSILNNAMIRFKKRNNDAYDMLKRMPNSAWTKMVAITGYNRRSRTSIMREMELNGDTYEFVVKEKLGAFLCGNTVNSICYNCKNCDAKTYSADGWLKCQCVMSKIPDEKYNDLYDMMDDKKMNVRMDLNNGDLYTALRIMPLSLGDCREYRRRSTFKSDVLSSFI